MKIRPVGAELRHAGRREDMNVKGAFGDYAKASEKKNGLSSTMPRYRWREAATPFVINSSTVWILRARELHVRPLYRRGKKSLRKKLCGPRGSLDEMEKG